MSKYVAAIDQGTTSTRFIIFDHAGNVIAVDQKEHKQIYPKPGWFRVDGRPAVRSADGALILDEVQPAGKKIMSGKSFLAGARDWAS